MYEFISHTADIGIRVKGKTLAELFQNAAFALFDIMTDIKHVHPVFEEHLEISADDLIELMNYWLSGLLREYTINNRLLSSFEIKSIDDKKLTALIKGEEYNQSKHNIKKEIKAVTFHNLYVKQTDKGWESEIIFDV